MLVMSALPEPTIPVMLGSDQIDREVVAIAQSFVAGRVSHAEAMRWLSRLASCSTIPAEEVEHRVKAGLVRYEDRVTSEEQLRDLLTEKLLPVHSGRVSQAAINFDLLAEGASFSGWLRAFSRSILSRTVGRSHARYRNVHVLEDGHPFEMTAPVEQLEAEAVRADDELELLERRSRGRSEEFRTYVKATALQSWLNLPEPRRPVTSAGREEVRQALDVGLRLNGHRLPPPVADLFAHYTPEEYNELTPQVTALLAEGAIVALPAVPRSVRRSLTAWATAQVILRWAPQVRKLTELWLTQRSGTVQCASGEVEKSDSQRLHEQNELWAVIIELIDEGVTAFGTSVDEVESTFRDRFVAIEREQFLGQSASITQPQGQGSTSPVRSQQVTAS